MEPIWGSLLCKNCVDDSTERPAKPNHQGKDGHDAAVINATELTVRGKTKRRLAEPAEPVHPAAREFAPDAKETEDDQLNPDQEIGHVLDDGGMAIQPTSEATARRIGQTLKFSA